MGQSVVTTMEVRSAGAGAREMMLLWTGYLESFATEKVGRLICLECSQK